MAKLTQLLIAACLVFLCSALDKTHTRANSTHFTRNSTFSSLMTVQRPSWLIEAAAKGVQNVNTSSDAFACPSGFSYLTLTDEQNNRQSVCNNFPAWGIIRLQSGGSADGPSYGCGSRSDDGRNLGQSACVKTTFAKIVEASGTTCPSGYSTVTAAEAANNKQQLCNYLGEWDIARIGVQGSMDGPGYGCGSRDWDDRGLGNALCVQRTLTTIQVPSTATEENVCGSGLSLVTVDEAMANRQAYCNTLGQWTIARLSGGGSFDGPGYGCHVRNEDVRSLGNALCAPNNRQA